MSDEEFNFLSKQKGSIVWHCTCCQASTVRLEDAIRQLEKRVKVNEDRLDQIESNEKETDNKINKAERVAEDARKAVASAQKDTVKVVFEELRERDERKCNVIFHGIGETAGETLEEEKEWDCLSFNNVMREMHVNLNYQDIATYSRRLGAKRQGRPRPLLVALRNDNDRATILANSHNLIRSKLREVSVVPDLTQQQREADEELRKEASRRNREDLTAVDRQKNYAGWLSDGRVPENWSKRNGGTRQPSVTQATGLRPTATHRQSTTRKGQRIQRRTT